MTCPTRPDERLSPRVGHRSTAVQTSCTGGNCRDSGQEQPMGAAALTSARRPGPDARPRSGQVLDHPRRAHLSGRGQTRTMSEQANQQAEPSNIVVVGPDGMAIEGGENDHGERPVIEMVEQRSQGDEDRQHDPRSCWTRSKPLLWMRRAGPGWPRSTGAPSRSWRTAWPPSWLTSSSGFRSRSPRVTRPASPSCGSRRPSWSAGWRAVPTASRRRCLRSRWPPGPSLSRCAGRCHPA